jgi:hypothetical protein
MKSRFVVEESCPGHFVSVTVPFILEFFDQLAQTERGKSVV